MKNIEILFLWGTIFLYALTFVCHLVGFTWRKSSLEKISKWLLKAGFLLNTMTGLVHWIVSKHPPVTDTYELNLTGVWITILIFLLFEMLGKVEYSISLVVVPLSFLALGYGYLSGVYIKPMGPAFQSPWLIVHVVFAWLAFGSYAISTGAAFFLLLKERKKTSEKPGRLPDAEDLDLIGYRFIVLGFINHAVMIISGAIWAKKLWGHYWNWDPLETWSLIAFLVYAFYLHARSFLNWRMKKSAWMAIAGIIILIISFWGVGLFGPTIHPGP
ncbi:MAG: cytochrome c biogenesis protein CcsA [Acidobacteriota bacterium]